jgi:hypothetical protein
LQQLLQKNVEGYADNIIQKASCRKSFFCNEIGLTGVESAHLAVLKPKAAKMTLVIEWMSVASANQ